MSRNPTSRSVLIHAAVIAALMTSAAGCPSGGDSGDTRLAPPASNDESPPRPDAQQQPPVAEPGLLPEGPVVGQIDGPPSQPAHPENEADNPVRQTGGDSETLPNPLRNGAKPPRENPPTDDPTDDTAGPRPKGVEREPFDPIKVNGPIFVGWPKPKLALVITGRQDGYLEPCGCAGLDRMKGGMSRRHTFFNQLRQDQGWPVVAVDVGGLAKGYGVQAELKFQTMVLGMQTMAYNAITLGEAELRLPAASLLSADSAESPLVSANVALFGFAAQITAQTRVVEAAGMKLGITGVLGKECQKEIRNDEIEMVDPEAALSRLVPELKQKADYLILLAHATKKESIELARKFPDFDLVVTSDSAPVPPFEPATIEGTETLLIEVGQKGMDAVVLGMFDDPKQRLRYQSVPLDSRFPASQQMQQLMGLYQDSLKDRGFEGLGIRAVSHPQEELNGAFVGSEKCKECHEKSYIIWKKSWHAKAYETLTALKPPRNFDPECVSCHVVGWHPTEHFPYKTGYEGPEKTPHLTATGCETCHGPGGAHVHAENGSDFDLQDKLRKAVVITKDESQDTRSGKQHCFSCHDLDNSPEFKFETYWPLVEHYELEE